MKAALLVGRLFYSLIFILSAVGHFSAGTIDYASAAGVPAPEVLVPSSGILALAGGLSIALGWQARYGAWAVVMFLVPVTLAMHRFWGLGDAQLAMQQQIHFMKNLSLLGGALMVAYFGAGPYSLDSLRLRREVRGRQPRQAREPAEV